MISYATALQTVIAAARVLPPRACAIEHALGLVVAETVASPIDVPAFDNAAMDGFALRSADTQEATPDAARKLRILGSIAAGDAPPAATPPGAAWEITTGAAMPGDCDAVLAVERATLSSPAHARSIAVHHALAQGANRRNAGEDFRRGEILLRAGQPVTAQAVMALAATGCRELKVRDRPRIAVITTGSELAGSSPASIHDANGPYLEALLHALGLHLSLRRTVGDEPTELAAAIAAAALESDIVLTTGGVSAGHRDFVPTTIASMGAEIVFHKVAIRPGKPLLCARLVGGQLLFGLPGNPMAAAVGMRFFVLPAVRAMCGREPETYASALATGAVRKRPALTFFAKARAHVTPAARLEVTVLPGQESFKIAPLLRANCWAIVPEGVEDLAAGDILHVAPLLPAEFPAVGDEANAESAHIK